MSHFNGLSERESGRDISKPSINYKINHATRVTHYIYSKKILLGQQSNYHLTDKSVIRRY